MPGPNNYKHQSTLDNHSASLKPKLKDFTLDEPSKVPGPGAYSIPSTLKADKGSLDSKFSNPSSLVLHQSLNLSRRKEPNVYQPGPGACIYPPK